MTIQYPKRSLGERIFRFLQSIKSIPVHQDFRLFLLHLEEISDFVIEYNVQQGILQFPVVIKDKTNEVLVTFKGNVKTLKETEQMMHFILFIEASLKKEEEALEKARQGTYESRIINALIDAYHLSIKKSDKRQIKWKINRLIWLSARTKEYAQIEVKKPLEEKDIVSKDLTAIINNPKYSKNKREEAKTLLTQYKRQKAKNQKRESEKDSDREAEVIIQNIRKHYLDD